MKAILHILHKLVFKKCPVILYKHGCQGLRGDPTLNVNPLVIWFNIYSDENVL